MRRHLSAAFAAMFLLVPPGAGAMAAELESKLFIVTSFPEALSGRIQHREFLGSLIRYAVRVGGHVILVDDSHQAGRPVFDIGDDVVLDLEVDQVRILSN